HILQHLRNKTTEEEQAKVFELEENNITIVRKRVEFDNEANTVFNETSSTSVLQNDTSEKNNFTNQQITEIKNQKEDYEEDLSLISEAEFGEYFQEWEEMLEEEENSTLNDEGQDDILDSELDDTIYLAVDNNAKWKLANLFCPIDLP
ncbi:11821_t:CDS:2, partial [Dentiscutata erythropus]